MKIIKQTLVHAGKWLNLHTATFQSSNTTGVWEYVTRPTRFTDFDGVAVLARVHHEGKEKIVTIASYRLPIDQWVLEFPAGMIEKDDNDIVKAALREFKEETGLSVRESNVKGLGMLSYNDPWKSNECNMLVKVDVDIDGEENKQPVQELDPAEEIKVELVPTDGILQHLEQICKEKKYALDSRVYSFALGVEMGKGKG